MKIKESQLKPKWSAKDRQSYRDGDRLRACSVPGRRDPGPQASEWDYVDTSEEA